MNKITKKTSKKILIIEDETMLQEALIVKLKSEGYLVRGCTNSEDAFELMKEDKPDLILTDLVINNVDGFEILKILKENFNLKDIPVVVLTNLAEGEDTEKAMALGAHDFIIKANTSLEEIIRKVKEVFE